MKYLNKFNEELDEDAFIQGEEGIPESNEESDIAALEDFCNTLDEELGKEKYDDSDWGELITMAKEKMDEHNISFEDIGKIMKQDWYYECMDILSEYHYREKMEKNTNNDREEKLESILESYIKEHIEHIYDNTIEKDGEVLFEGNKVIYSIIIEKGN